MRIKSERQLRKLTELAKDGTIKHSDLAKLKEEWNKDSKVRVRTARGKPHYLKRR